MAKLMKTTINIILTLIILVIIAVFLQMPSEKKDLKHAIVQIDFNYLGGLLHSLYFQQPLESEMITSFNPLPNDAYSWVKPNTFYAVAHRLGPYIETGENRIATLTEGLAQGFRFFEVDLVLTTDKRLICMHEHGQDFENISYTSYQLESQTNGLMPCTLESLVEQAVADPHIYFIIDMKNNFEEAYAMMKTIVAKKNVGRSFIPQIYSITQANFIREGQVFSGEIYTVYRAAASNETIYNNARRAKIPVVNLPLNRLNPKTQPNDLLVFTHAVNDPFQALSLKKQGVSGIFTSYLSPNYFPAVYHSPQ